MLFGSYAYGTPTEDSDMDILVVTRSGSKGESLLNQQILPF